MLKHGAIFSKIASHYSFYVMKNCIAIYGLGLQNCLGDKYSESAQKFCIKKQVCHHMEHAICIKIASQCPNATFMLWKIVLQFID